MEVGVSSVEMFGVEDKFVGLLEGYLVIFGLFVGFFEIDIG